MGRSCIKERQIGFRLLYAGVVTTKELEHHIWGRDEDGGPEYGSTLIGMYICSLRKRCPVRIWTRRGHGYEVLPEDYPILHDWLVDDLQAYLAKKGPTPCHASNVSLNTPLKISSKELMELLVTALSMDLTSLPSCAVSTVTSSSADASCS